MIRESLNWWWWCCVRSTLCTYIKHQLNQSTGHMNIATSYRTVQTALHSRESRYDNHHSKRQQIHNIASSDSSRAYFPDSAHSRLSDPETTQTCNPPHQLHESMPHIQTSCTCRVCWPQPERCLWCLFWYLSHPLYQCLSICSPRTRGAVALSSIAVDRWFTHPLTENAP